MSWTGKKFNSLLRKGFPPRTNAATVPEVYRSQDAASSGGHRARQRLSRGPDPQQRKQACRGGPHGHCQAGLSNAWFRSDGARRKPRPPAPYDRPVIPEDIRAQKKAQSP
ncbi:hypothetical protein GCM10009612_33710 [Streptomyces beijiangensis]